METPLYKDPLLEPVDHAIGRSRGGLTTKIHSLVDGQGRPLVLLVSAGQANDSPWLPVLLERLSVPRNGPGRPRTRPDALLADRAYTSDRVRLRAAKVVVVIPEKSTNIAARRRRGRAGGRPPAFDAQLYKRRNVVERSYNIFKQWRALANRYDCTRSSTAESRCSDRSRSGASIGETHPNQQCRKHR